VTVRADGVALVHRDRNEGLAYARSLSQRAVIGFVLCQALPCAVVPDHVELTLAPAVLEEVKAGRTEGLQFAIAEAMGNTPAGEDDRWLATNARSGETRAYSFQRQAGAVAAYLLTAGEPAAAVWEATFAHGQAPVVDEPFCDLPGTEVWATPENVELVPRLGFEVTDETGKFVFLPGDSITAVVEAPSGWRLFGLVVLQASKSVEAAS